MRLRSLRSRLSVLFFGVTLVAVGVMFFYVTPQLESSLREQKYRSLARTARDFTPRIEQAVVRQDTARQLNQAVGEIGDATSTRVTVLTVGNGSEGVQPSAILSESTAEVRRDGLRYDVAVDAATSGREAQGSEYRGSVLLGQVAEPIRTGGKVSHVVVFMSPLSEVQGNVALIRRQILIAGGLGLLLALGGGFVVSNAIARRVKLLEQGAERVAGGDFTAVFPAESEDELGQLARALDDMQRQLAEVETARRRFITTASHELRTPIFSLGGFLELLEDEDLDDDTRREFVAVVREQVARLGKLATDLLDLSKLEAGSLVLRPERTDLGELASRVTSEFGPALGKHESDLALRVAGHRIEAVCDPERVAQILRILLDNALTHTPVGTDVVVTAARRNGAVRLGVSDCGPGLRDDAVDRVFEPFFTSDDAQGSGLGLAIARELAECMHGSLDVDSVPGRTTFSFELPA